MDKVFIDKVALGTEYEIDMCVGLEDTAKSFGSGGMYVLSTPRMIALMEEASFKLTQSFLDKGLTTVGTVVNIKHVAPTPIGMKVVVKARLDEIHGRRLLFTVSARDERESIGEGKHERFIVFEDKFIQRANEK